MDIPRPQQPKGRKRLMYGGAALAALVTVTVALSRLEPAAPSVDRGTIWFDTVRQGSMLRQVRGPGTLVPEQMRQVSAVTSGRVERLLAEPGDTVQPGTVLIEISNPDVQLRALEAQQQLAAAEAQLVSTRSNLRTQILAQEATVATARADYQDAQRQADNAVATTGLFAEQEVKRLLERAEQMEVRLKSEVQRLEVFKSTQDEQIAVQQSQVERLREVVSFQHSLIQSMRVRAGSGGVLRDLGAPPLEEGQWVLAGMRLATVVQPSRLKAELRIPETQARDVVIGQRALIDTRTDTIHGHVSRVDPASQSGTVTVDVALEGELPRGARPDLSVDGTIEIERLDNVLYMGRPAYGQSNSVVGIFKADPDGNTARRVNVRLGRASVNQIEIVEGLAKGDVVVLSDMSRWDAVDRVRIR
ncbi:MAG: HlyD family efflux transporter periplasmic adaptor subunit [Gemmatimonadetes bacterium]|nr:HlyD family efflux transporter periplasmic adaptor subunit [Gemmatimonadota bacterium]